MSEPTRLPVHLAFDVPESQRGGLYANMLNVWHTEHEFTLDFAAQQPAQVHIDEQGQQVAVLACTVVARIHIPPTLLFEVIRAINANMTGYEQVFGSIRRPGEDGEPPLYPPSTMTDDGSGGDE